ncbi:MAG: hypothetical protein EKK36_00655 [Bradyrhizobiaceae bacterium]|nr:MAG: hypothetical protein EKK36_00655 [Bradyrhizobiaceae bacterium]
MNLNPDVFTDALVSYRARFLDWLPILALSQLVPDRLIVSRTFAGGITRIVPVWPMVTGFPNVSLNPL